MSRGLIELPTIYYFEQKNKYSGSLDKIFRYKIFPSDKLLCKIWHSEFAIDSISEDEITDVAEFELTAEGLGLMIDWIEDRYMEYALELQRKEQGKIIGTDFLN